MSEHKKKVGRPRKKRTLEPVRHMRAAAPRVCGTCESGQIIDGRFACQRPGGLQCDATSLHHWHTSCDLYKLDPLWIPTIATRNKHLSNLPPE